GEGRVACGIHDLRGPRGEGRALRQGRQELGAARGERHGRRRKRSRCPQCEALTLGLRHPGIQGQIASHQARRCNRGAEIFVSGGDPASPCIGACVLDSANGYCRGCWRTLDEITGWPAASTEEKRRILSILEGRRLTAARMPSLLSRAAETLHVPG